MTEIGLRLKTFRMRSGTKMPMVEKSTGIAKETLYKWEKGTRPADIENYNKLKAYLDERELQLNGDFVQPEIANPTKLILPLKNNGLSKPHTDGNITSGTIIFTGKVPELIVDRIDMPFLGPVDGAIQITGYSMEPTFAKGSWVTITRQNNFTNLDWGQYYYLVDSHYKGNIWRIYQSAKKDTFLLMSDNHDYLKYPQIEKSLDQIKAIFRVGAMITKL